MAEPFDLSLLHKPNLFQRNILDRDTGQPIPSNNKGYPPTNLGMALETNSLENQEALSKAQMLALLFKKHYPNMPDNEIGMHVRRMLLNTDLHESAFGNALGRSQQQLNMSY